MDTRKTSYYTLWFLATIFLGRLSLFNADTMSRISSAIEVPPAMEAKLLTAVYLPVVAAVFIFPLTQWILREKLGLRPAAWILTVVVLSIGLGLPLYLTMTSVAEAGQLALQ